MEKHKNSLRDELLSIHIDLQRLRSRRVAYQKESQWAREQHYSASQTVGNLSREIELKRDELEKRIGEL